MPTYQKTQKPKKSQRAISVTASHIQSSQRDHPDPTASQRATQSDPPLYPTTKMLRR